MKQHEREYFVSRIRSGIYYIYHNNIKVKVLTPTIEDELLANDLFNETYQLSLDDDLMTEEEMLDWMESKGFWTEKDDEKIKGLEKDLERLRVEIFNARNNESLRETIRQYIRAGERQLKKQIEKKSEYHGNTCEGIASLEKSIFLIKRCSFIGSEPFDFKSIDPNLVWMLFYSMLLNEKQSRELARTEPWRSLWMLKDSGTTTLFYNKDRELSIDQKNILIWSRMYENIQESMDCPSDDVIQDDDMLDGWFIVQRKKQEKEKAKAELESGLTNSKISNSDEIFVVAGSKGDAERINDMNDIHGMMTKKERMQVVYGKGAAEDKDFRDQQLKMRRQSTQQYKGKFGR